MPNSWYIFPTRALALQGCAQISELMACPIAARNCETNEVDSSAQMTEKWAVPVQSQSGWAVPVPTNPSHAIQAVIIDDPIFPKPSIPQGFR